MSERLHEPNEIADLRSELEASRATRAKERGREAATYRRWQAAEGRIERAREKLLVRWVDGSVLTHKQMIDRALGILTEAANAEGIASEGGSAQAANPREKGMADAPSAEAGQPIPSIRLLQLALGVDRRSRGSWRRG